MDKAEGQHRNIRRSWLRRGLFLAILLLVGFGGGAWLASAKQDKVEIPQSILNKIAFPIYLPKKLPGNYQIDENSFTLSEEAVVFRASDATGATIAFTEQLKPENFDFDAFYAQQFNDAKTLDNVPFPSVSGKSQANDSTIASIVTDDGTWIMANTRAPMDAEALRTIAKSIQRYKNY